MYIKIPRICISYLYDKTEGKSFIISPKIDTMCLYVLYDHLKQVRNERIYVSMDIDFVYNI